MKKLIIALVTTALLVTTTACSSSDSNIDQSVKGTTAGATSAEGLAQKPTTLEGESTPVEKTTGESEESDNVAALTERVLVDEEDIRITATALEDTWMGPALKVLIENNSDKDLTFQTRSTSVNGYMVETMFSPDVAAGKKSNDEIIFSASELEAAGIKDIADIETSFHVFTTDDWETYHDTDSISVKTTLAAGYTYSYDDAGELLYDDKDIRIIAKGISNNDSLFGPGLVVYIENMGDESISVQARNVSINGFMVETIFSAEIAPGKRILDAVTFLDSDLETNNIEEITEVELGFRIFGTDDWETVDDTDQYSLAF